MAFIAAALLASCSDDKDYSGDFGQIKVPDTRQLEQTVSADDTQSARGVTFTTEGAWTSTIAETRAEAPAWISISPDRGDAAGSYTLKITLEPNTSGASRTATIVITCGTSKIEITVTQEGGKLVIALHIKVGFGLNISTITQSITHRVKDEVELATGLKVARIDVYVDDIIAD